MDVFLRIKKKFLNIFWRLKSLKLFFWVFLKNKSLHMEDFLFLIQLALDPRFVFRGIRYDSLVTNVHPFLTPCRPPWDCNRWKGWSIIEESNAPRPKSVCLRLWNLGIESSPNTWEPENGYRRPFYIAIFKEKTCFVVTCSHWNTDWFHDGILKQSTRWFVRFWGSLASQLIWK